MAFVAPGSFNAYVAQATGQVISYIRDPAKYRVMQYTQLVHTAKDIGVYYKIHPDDSARLVNDEARVWADGARRPYQDDDSLRFDTVEFQTTRRDFNANLGWKTIEQADLKVLVGHTAKIRNEAQISRTQRVITLGETTGNWAGNTATAITLNVGAGYWDTAASDEDSVNYLAIKKTLDEVARRIHLGTNGVVGDFNEDGDDNGLMLILSPGAALKISQSAEIHNYLRESVYSLPQITGGKRGQNAIWGLPSFLYGWKVVVENAVRVSELQKADGTAASSTSGSPPPRRFVKSDDSVICCTRPGGLDGQYGAPNYSTFQLYYTGKEMQVETIDEPKDRLTEVHVVTDDKAVLAAPASGFLVTDILSGV
jgi:hypothetical protein